MLLWIMIGLTVIFFVASIPFLAWVASNIGCGPVIFGVVAAVIIAVIAIYYHENINPLLPFTILDMVIEFVTPDDLPKCADGVKGLCLK